MLAKGSSKATITTVGEIGAPCRCNASSTALSAGVGKRLEERSLSEAQISTPENTHSPRKLKKAKPHSRRLNAPTAATEQRSATPAAVAPAAKNSTTPAK